MAKSKYSRVVSPKGIAKWAWLNKADEGYNGQDADNPKYKVTLVMEDNDETRAWCKKVMETAKAEAKANGVKLKKVHKSPFRFPEDQDEDDFVPAEGKDKPKYDEDFKDAIFFETKSQYKPGLIDAAKQELPEDTYPMGGDIVRIKVQLNPYEGLGSGVSFQLITVQLIEKNTSYSGGGGVDDGGFEEEDGYAAGGQTEGDDEDDDDDIPF